jgi:hypothetical protein
MISESELWLLSFYRSSEITGSLFFGRLARSMREGALQRDMTKHFADEAMHSWYWTKCIEDLGAKPIKLREAYQDQYLEAAGMPVNVMEVLAVTQVFEQRVIGQYAVHANVVGLDPHIQSTLRQIMEDEKWHIQWVRDALHSLEPKYGAELIASTLKRYKDADSEVYQNTLAEQSERINEILKAREVHAA